MLVPVCWAFHSQVLTALVLLPSHSLGSWTLVITKGLGDGAELPALQMTTQPDPWSPAPAPDPTPEFLSVWETGSFFSPFAS